MDCLKLMFEKKRMGQILSRLWSRGIYPFFESSRIIPAVLQFAEETGGLSSILFLEMSLQLDFDALEEVSDTKSAEEWARVHVARSYTRMVNTYLAFKNMAPDHCADMVSNVKNIANRVPQYNPTE
ncbi:MAG: hypothetical protein EOP48_34500, partial [Sphingobacteriales bacterium]